MCFPPCDADKNNLKVNHRAVSKPAPAQVTQAVNQPIPYSPNRQAQQARKDSATQKILRQRTADSIQKKYR